MKCRFLLLSLLLLIMPALHGATAHSAMTGKDFLQEPQSYQNGFVNGFVRGMYLTCLDHLETKKEVCSSAPVLDATFEMTPDQVLDIFLNYIRKNTEIQQREVSELLLDCLKENVKKPEKPQ